MHKVIPFFAATALLSIFSSGPIAEAQTNRPSGSQLVLSLIFDSCECDALYADVFEAQGMAPWTVDPVDGVHPNNLGHRMIANRIFETA